MYTQDKRHRITVRLNDNQFEFVKRSADLVDVSPSDFLRMVINAAMSTTPDLEAAISKKVGGPGRENDKTNSNDLV